MDWGGRKGKEGKNESVYDANNSHIIERPQNECAPCGFYQPKDWLNTSRPNVLKLRNAFLGNVSKKETEKNFKKTKKKKPRSRLEKLCRVKLCKRFTYRRHKFRYVVASFGGSSTSISDSTLLPGHRTCTCLCYSEYKHTHTHTYIHVCLYVCSYMCLLESLINISHSDRVQWNSLSYQLAECSWVIDSFQMNLNSVRFYLILGGGR